MATSLPFELLSSGRVRIGQAELKIHVDDDVAADDDRYVIEATADLKQKFGQYFPPHGLQAVRPTDLPNGLYLAIERLESGRSTFRNLHHLTLRKRGDQVTLNLYIYFEHLDWHLPESIATFAERYADALVAASQLGASASTHIQDTGVGVDLLLFAPPNRDIYSTYRDAADSCLLQFRSCVAQGYKTPKTNDSDPLTKTTPKTESADSSGTKWWVRYVLVPLLGSGAFAAVIAALIAFTQLA
jgi:hypothetical protein